MGLEVDEGFEDYEVSDEVFGKLIEPNLIQPTFVTHLPKELCPFAKITLDDPSTIDVFELCIGGMEIAPAYSEQNDPDMQRKCSRSRRARKLRISTTTFWKPRIRDAFRWGWEWDRSDRHSIDQAENIRMLFSIRNYAPVGGTKLIDTRDALVYLHRSQASFPAGKAVSGVHFHVYYRRGSRGGCVDSGQQRI